jgi:hypothetical protein
MEPQGNMSLCSTYIQTTCVIINKLLATV